MNDCTPVAGSESRSYPARLEILPETAAFVEAFCAARGIRRDDAFRLTLILEELVTNTLMHGYRGECDSPIAITLALDARGVRVTYEDAAPPFDPSPALARAHDPLDAPAAARPVGHLGLRLVGQMATEARYARDGARNRLQLLVPPGRT